jgi:uncharacterized protein affecting Mg2+/Co2+ transport
MKEHRRYCFALLLLMVLVVSLYGTAISAKKTTIIGKVNDNYQIVTADGRIYEVEGNAQGDEVVNLVGRQVRATGIVEESAAMNIITISSYEVIGQKNLTIVGTVNGSYQIVTNDGNIYTVEENEMGFELIDECVGKQVRATGTIEDTEDMKIITVTSYEVIGE